MVVLIYNGIVLLSYYLAPESRFKGRAICNYVVDRITYGFPYLHKANRACLNLYLKVTFRLKGHTMSVGIGLS